jgi:hypothetical protein
MVVPPEARKADSEHPGKRPDTSHPSFRQESAQFLQRSLPSSFIDNFSPKGNMIIDNIASDFRFYRSFAPHTPFQCRLLLTK